MVLKTSSARLIVNMINDDPDDDIVLRAWEEKLGAGPEKVKKQTQLSLFQEISSESRE